jgi:hypothetical protein
MGDTIGPSVAATSSRGFRVWNAAVRDGDEVAVEVRLVPADQSTSATTTAK